jgi:hypothetical protein
LSLAQKSKNFEGKNAAFLLRRLLESRKGVGTNLKKRSSRQTNTTLWGDSKPNMSVFYAAPNSASSEGSKDLAALFAVW